MAFVLDHIMAFVLERIIVLSARSIHINQLFIRAEPDYVYVMT
jgi:hypothetical protein